MKNVSDYMVYKGYTPETKKSQYSVLSELYDMVVIRDIQENFSTMLQRLNIGKSQSNCQTRTSIIKNFLIYQNGFSTNPAQISHNGSKSLEDTKKEFKANLIKFVRQLHKHQKANEVNQLVSFYTREGKQLYDYFDYIAESVLLDTISARFNKKQSDQKFVSELVKQFFPNPSQKVWIDLPTKGEFLNFVKKSNPKMVLMSKADIIAKYPEIDPNCLKVEDYIPKHDPQYVWLKGERDMITASMLLNESLFITGVAGIGKSSMLAQWCYEEKCPYIRTACNYSAEPQDNYFKQKFDGVRSSYIMINMGLSFIISCMYGICMNSQEEINSSNEQSMIAMHSATDSIKSLSTEIGTLELNEGCKMLIAGSGNIGYGQGDLTPALHSRLMPMDKIEPSDKFILENIWV
jgi:hypothetical protein